MLSFSVDLLFIFEFFLFFSWFLKPLYFFVFLMLLFLFFDLFLLFLLENSLFKLLKRKNMLLFLSLLLLFDFNFLLDIIL